MDKKRSKLILFISLLFFSSVLSVQAKSYFYDSIKVNIVVNKDSTFDVEERQTFNYTGEFHQAWRSIRLNKVSKIDNIQVLDGVTGEPVVFSVNKSKGYLNIKWNYNLKDTVYEWIIKYKVHGGLGFYKDHDEIYWNLFTNYDVPVNYYEAVVKIPDNNFSLSDLKVYNYSEGQNNIARIVDNKTFYFSGSNVLPRQAVTIAVGWPKGLISQPTFWFDFLKINLGYVLSFFIILLNILIGFIYWFFKEKYRRGRGTIISQYEPPQNLRPAMVEVICKEKITNKAWPATIIDLAVRGYIKIKEDKLTLINYLWGALRIFKILFLVVLIILTFNQYFYLSLFLWGILIYKAFFLLQYFLSGGSLKDLVLPKDYIIERVKGSNRPNLDFLEDYEKKFLDILFSNKNYFSTKELKKSPQRTKNRFYSRMLSLEKELYKETEQDTGVFERKISIENKKKSIFLFFVILFLYISIKYEIIENNQQYLFLLLSSILSTLGLYFFIKFDARLTKEGEILKEDWLGFKLYLETAEKYRLQNLTPETFEKYLPYAIIFGVEKKWGRAFESIQMSPPNWYGGAYIGPSFPSAFCASFSASFSSAFSSSGALGDGAGGGGSAGGGRGGGGGGAS